MMLANRIVSITEPGSRTLTYSYDDKGDLIESVDFFECAHYVQLLLRQLRRITT